MSRAILCVFSLLLSLETAPAAAPPRFRRDLDGDPLPAGAVARMGSTRWRHYYQFNAAPRFSADGRHVLAARHPNGLRVWDAATGRMLAELAPTEEWPPWTATAVMPDGKRFLSLTQEDEGTIVLRRYPTGEPLRHYRRAGLLSLTVSPDGRLVAGQWGDRHIYLIDLEKRKRLPPLPRIVGDFRSLAFTPDGDVTVVHYKRAHQRAPEFDSPSWSVSRVDLTTRRVRRAIEFESPEEPTQSPTGQHVAAVTDQGIWVWDTGTGRRTYLPVGKGLDGLTASFTQDGKALLIGNNRLGVLWFWDLGRNEPVHRLRLPPEHSPKGFALSPDGKTLLAACENRAILLDARTGRPLPSRPGMDDWDFRVAYSRDGRSIVACEPRRYVRGGWPGTDGGYWRNGSMYTWEAATGRLVSRTVPAWTDPHEAGPFIGPSGVASVYGLGNYIALPERGDTAQTIAVSGDGLRMVSVSATGQVSRRNVLTGKAERILDLPKGEEKARQMLLSADGHRLALAGEGASFQVYDLRGGKKVATIIPSLTRLSERSLLENYPGAILLTGFRLEGRWLYLVNGHGLQVWDVEIGEKVYQFGYKEGPVQLSFGLSGPPPNVTATASPDGRFLALLRPYVEVVEVYEVASGEFLCALPGQSSPMVFSPCRPEVATVDGGRLSVLRWDLEELLFSAPHSDAGTSTATELWQDLASPDAARALRAAWQLARTAGMEEYLHKHLRAVPRPDADAVRRHLRDLASADYATRQRADSSLRDCGQPVLTSLKAALTRADDLELRHRLRRLLAQVGGVTPEWLRQQRAVLALELRATPEARRLLQRLADGAPGAWLTDEAAGGVRRLAARGP